MRTRLSETPSGKKLTYSNDISLAECENFILETAIKNNSFKQWLAHLVHFYLQISKEPNPYSIGDNVKDFENLREVIYESLAKSNYIMYSEMIRLAKNEIELNSMIISQYTDESQLYREVNLLLRDGHEGKDIGNEPLVPWILQLNAAIRCQDEYIQSSYRGANLTAEELNKYKVGDMFIWSPFTSASKAKSKCLGGNVIFEFKPISSISEYGKRAPRDISKYSYFPEEEEVLFPICCCFRITSIQSIENNRTLIKMDILDHN